MIPISGFICTVATAPTGYGIETPAIIIFSFTVTLKLQQHLPFTVLKLYTRIKIKQLIISWLQQHLPFTVLKPPSMLPTTHTFL